MEPINKQSIIYYLEQFEPSLRKFEDKIISKRLERDMNFEYAFDEMPNYCICSYIFKCFSRSAYDSINNIVRKPMFEFLQNNPHLTTKWNYQEFENNSWFNNNQERVTFIKEYLKHIQNENIIS